MCCRVDSKHLPEDRRRFLLVWKERDHTRAASLRHGPDARNPSKRASRQAPEHHPRLLHRQEGRVRPAPGLAVAIRPKRHEISGEAGSRSERRSGRRVLCSALSRSDASSGACACSGRSRSARTEAGVSPGLPCTSSKTRACAGDIGTRRYISRGRAWEAPVSVMLVSPNQERGRPGSSLPNRCPSRGVGHARRNDSALGS
jgi:hypothetical protein